MIFFIICDDKFKRFKLIFERAKNCKKGRRLTQSGIEQIKNILCSKMSKERQNETILKILKLTKTKDFDYRDQFFINLRKLFALGIFDIGLRSIVFREVVSKKDINSALTLDDCKKIISILDTDSTKQLSSKQQLINALFNQAIKYIDYKVSNKMFQDLNVRNVCNFLDDKSVKNLKSLLRFYRLNVYGDEAINRHKQFIENILKIYAKYWDVVMENTTDFLKNGLSWNETGTVFLLFTSLSECGCRYKDNGIFNRLDNPGRRKGIEQHLAKLAKNAVKGGILKYLDVGCGEGLSTVFMVSAMMQDKISEIYLCMHDHRDFESHDKIKYLLSNIAENKKVKIKYIPKKHLTKADLISVIDLSFEHDLSSSNIEYLIALLGKNGKCYLALKEGLDLVLGHKHFKVVKNFTGYAHNIDVNKFKPNKHEKQIVWFLESSISERIYLELFTILPFVIKAGYEKIKIFLNAQVDKKEKFNEKIKNLFEVCFPGVKNKLYIKSYTYKKSICQALGKLDSSSKVVVTGRNRFDFKLKELLSINELKKLDLQNNYILCIGGHCMFVDTDYGVIIIDSNIDSNNLNLGDELKINQKSFKIQKIDMNLQDKYENSKDDKFFLGCWLETISKNFGEEVNQQSLSSIIFYMFKTFNFDRGKKKWDKILNCIDSKKYITTFFRPELCQKHEDNNKSLVKISSINNII
ncbi:MAG: hypothetical protein PVI75_05450 [Gammaproteobacteria bacterium]|jgi:hypothetical protein